MTKQQWLSWVKENYGSWRNWAMVNVAQNWRIRKRLPHITKAAIAKGLIDNEQ